MFLFQHQNEKTMHQPWTQKGPLGVREGLGHQLVTPKGALHAWIRRKGCMPKHQYLKTWKEDRLVMINALFNPKSKLWVFLLVSDSWRSRNWMFISLKATGLSSSSSPGISSWAETLSRHSAWSSPQNTLFSLNIFEYFSTCANTHRFNPYTNVPHEKVSKCLGWTQGKHFKWTILERFK